MYDVLIIGGGVIGALTARELSRYQLRVCLLEKDGDVVMGASKANSAIVHAGFDALPGTLKAKYNVLGNAMMEKTAKELSVPFKRNGSLVLAFTDEDVRTLETLLERGKENGVPGLRILSREEALKKEPALSPGIKAALEAPTGGIVCPYELAIGAMENAMDNGVELKTGFKVDEIRQTEDDYEVLSEGRGVKGRFVVNAAGVYADRIARLVGDSRFTITPRKGEYMLLDRTQGRTVSSTIFQPPTKMGKGVLVTPTVDGNLLLGPTSEDVTNRHNTATTQEGLSIVAELAKKSVPGVNTRAVITAFSGLRACSSLHDFVLGPVPGQKRFINAAGIESPGLTASPAIAVRVVECLRESGLRLTRKEDFNPFRRPFPKFREMSDEERQALIAKDPRFGRIVCRCEQITEGEIVEAIHRNPGARDLDAVKRRARAGMGRCQGGFCAPQVAEILARELGIPLETVTKCGGKSRLLVGKTK